MPKHLANFFLHAKNMHARLKAEANDSDAVETPGTSADRQHPRAAGPAARTTATNDDIVLPAQFLAHVRITDVHTYLDHITFTPEPTIQPGVPFIVTVLEDSAKGHTFTAIADSPAVITNALWRTRIFNDAIQNFGDPENMMDAALDGNDLYVVLSTDGTIINDVFTPDEIATEGMAADLDLPE